MDSKIYYDSNESTKESLKKIENKDLEENKIKEISKKINNVQSKLESKFGDVGKEFFIRNMNDYLKTKYNARFDLIDNNGKKEIVLVLEKGFDKNKLNQLISNLTVSDNTVFIDGNNDGKKDKGEKGIKIKNKGMEVDEIFVSKEEIESGKKQVGFGKIDNKEGNLTSDETLGGKITFKDGKSYYEVGNHKDYLAAPVRLFTAISNEYFGGMTTNEISKKIKDLGVKKGKNGYEFAKLPKEGYEKVGDFNSKKWFEIVKPHSKIDLSSLQDALDIKKITSKKEEKEQNENLSGWGRFYKGSKGEIWDIPDNWKNITYDGYAKDYKGLTGNQVSIGARNSYEGNEKNNNFALKKEIDLGNGKKGFFVLGETNSEILNKVKNLKNPDDISEQLEKSSTEAWFTTYEKGKDGKININIKEIGDKKVHVVTETPGSVEKGKDKNHPIRLVNNIYNFDGNIKGSIKFDISAKNKEKQEIKISNLNIKGKEINITDFKGKNKEKEFNKIFPGGKGYLQLSNNHVVELSFNKENGIKVKDLGIKKNNEFDAGGVKIQTNDAESIKFDKESKTLNFPNVIGWGKLSCKLEKHNGALLATLGEKINGNEIKIKLQKEDKINPEKLFNEIKTSLLYIGTTKPEKKDKKIDYPNGIEKKDNTILISYKNFKNKSQISLLKKLDTSGKISETFIMNGITKNISEKYLKVEGKKEEHSLEQTKSEKEKRQVVSVKTRPKEGNNHSEKTKF